MRRIKEYITYFTKEERLLWVSSVILIIASFGIFDRENYLTLSASLIGVTSLIFNAKGSICSYFMASQSLQWKQSRGESQSHFTK